MSFQPFSLSAFQPRPLRPRRLPPPASKPGGKLLRTLSALSFHTRTACPVGPCSPPFSPFTRRTQCVSFQPQVEQLPAGNSLNFARLPMAALISGDDVSTSAEEIYGSLRHAVSRIEIISLSIPTRTASLKPAYFSLVPTSLKKWYRRWLLLTPCHFTRRTASPWSRPLPLRPCVSSFRLFGLPEQATRCVSFSFFLLPSPDDAMRFLPASQQATRCVSFPFAMRVSAFSFQPPQQATRCVSFLLCLSFHLAAICPFHFRLFGPPQQATRCVSFSFFLPQTTRCVSSQLPSRPRGACLFLLRCVFQPCPFQPPQQATRCVSFSSYAMRVLSAHACPFSPSSPSHPLVGN